MLDLPSRPQIKEWLEQIHLGKKKSYSKYLICRFMLNTGVRLHEAVALETRQWPSGALIDRCHKRGRDYVHLKLIVTKSGAMRTIRMSIVLALNVRVWIDEERGKLLRTGLKSGKARPTDRLFLSDSLGFEGIPIQGHTVYDCFREVEPRPEGWHPHMARHAYACHRLMDLIAAEWKADRGAKGPSWVDAKGRFAIDLIRRQLGHVSEETTQAYLAYLRNGIGMIKFNDHYQGTLDKGLA